MTHRLIVVPCWGGRPRDYWYPWLQRELARAEPAYYDPVVVADMPNPDLPTIPAWVDRLAEIVGSDAGEVERTVLVGHSVGAQAVVRTLERLSQDVAVAGTLLVAGWLEVDQPWAAIRPWVETPIDSARVRAATKWLEVLLSDNDPFTSDYETGRRRWTREYDATVYVESGARHFNGLSEPSVLHRLDSDPVTLSDGDGTSSV
jgi:predicted alpha/beta hydrolase family esterase